MTTGYILLETGDHILQEDGTSKLIVWSAQTITENCLTQETGSYILQEDGSSKLIIGYSYVTLFVRLISPALRYTVMGELSGWWEITASLPTTNATLTNTYTPAQITAVMTEDGSRVNIGPIPEGSYEVHLFCAAHANNTDGINIHLNLRSAAPPTSRAVTLQIYNFNTPAWETLASDNTDGAGSDFDVYGSQGASLSHYYDANNLIWIRVYQ